MYDLGQAQPGRCIIHPQDGIFITTSLHRNITHSLLQCIALLCTAHCPRPQETLDEESDAKLSLAHENRWAGVSLLQDLAPEAGA